MRLKGKFVVAILGVVGGLGGLAFVAWACLQQAAGLREGNLWDLTGVLALGIGGLARVLPWLIDELFLDRLRLLSASLRKVADGDASPESIVVTGNDELTALAATAANLIGDLTRREGQLRAALQAAEAACRLKSQFVANISHEIRTPMTAILGFVDLITSNIDRCPYSSNDDPCPQQAKSLEYAQTIERNGNYLLQILNDVLDLSKIEAGKCDLEHLHCHVAELLNDVRSLVEIKCREKGLAFSIECGTPIPETICTDPFRLRQILLNLLSNAVKFTERGSVRLVVRYPAEPGQDVIAFDVIDTGIGITATQMTRLFQPFGQGDSTTTRKFGGTGLGLTISKRLAMMLGGDLTVASQPGQGSLFRVTVATGCVEGVRLTRQAEPLLPSPLPDTVPQAPAVTLTGCRVLLAEDGPDTQRLISCLLTKAGAELVVVENGRQALETALQAEQQSRPFDVVLMDMQMPVLSGYEAARTLRLQGYTRPIIALTAHALAGDRDKCLAAGCNEYVAKPIDKRQLLQTIAQWGTPRDTTPLHPAHLLVEPSRAVAESGE